MSDWYNRYIPEHIQSIWSTDNKIKLWAAVEISVLHAQSDQGIIPEEWYLTAANQPAPTLEAMQQAELETRHEMVAFLAAWGLDHVHIGLTSSDVMDTATALQIGTATEAISTALQNLAETIAEVIALSGDDTVWARTHGQPAERVPRGRFLQFALAWLVEARANLDIASQEVFSTAKIRGPVGEYNSAITREVEKNALRRLGLWSKNEPVLQTSTRHYWAKWLSAIGEVACLIEWLATQIRLEVQPGGAWVHKPPKQVSSSAMPHKNNPILAERACGLARVIKAFVPMYAETVSTQWGFRDLTNSSIERIIFPTATGLAVRAANDLASALTQIMPNGPGASPTPKPNEPTTDYQELTTSLLRGGSYLALRGLKGETE